MNEQSEQRVKVQYLRSLPRVGRHTPRYRWQSLTAQDVTEAENMAVQVLPPAIAAAALAALRLHAKDATQFTEPSSELARLVRDIRWLALGDVPDGGHHG